MKIQQLDIKGYQSHKSTSMALSPGLNIVIGPSHNGKTAIVRAMRKALYDLPAGGDFINFDMPECDIRMIMDTGIVWRCVGAKNGKVTTNEYKTCGPDTTKSKKKRSEPSPEATFAGFGRTIPVEVVDITGVEKLTVGGEVIDLIFSSQLDSPFFVKRGSVWAKLFGRATGVDILDLCAKESRRRSTQAGNSEKNHREATKELQGRHSDLSENLEDAESYATELVEKADDLKDRLARLVEIKSLVDRGRLIRQKSIVHEDKLKELVKDLADSEDELDEYLRSSKLCPYSGASLPDECIDGIKKRT